MTDKINISPEKTPRIDQIAMAEAMGASALLGDSIEFPDYNKKAFGFVPADEIAKSKADRYDAEHPIVPNTHVAPAQASVLDILKSDGVDEPLKADKHIVPSPVIASAQRRHPEVTSKTDPDYDEMWIDGIMKRVLRN